MPDTDSAPANTQHRWQYDGAEPMKPHHVNTLTPVEGAPGLGILRVLSRYKFWNDFHNGHRADPGPVYTYYMIVDGRMAFDGPSRKNLLDEARQPGAYEKIKGQLGWK